MANSGLDDRHLPHPHKAGTFSAEEAASGAELEAFGLAIFEDDGEAGAEKSEEGETAEGFGIAVFDGGDSSSDSGATDSREGFGAVFEDGGGSDEDKGGAVFSNEESSNEELAVPFGLAVFDVRA